MQEQSKHEPGTKSGHHAIQGLFVDYELPFESVVFSRQAVDKIVQRTFDVTYSKRIDSWLVPYTAGYCFNSVKELLNMADINHDQGEFLGKVEHEASWAKSEECVRIAL